MPEILPFPGLRYASGKVNLADVAAPPYDVISPELQADLYDRSPFNVVRLILGREKERYEEAARNLREWTRKGILQRDVLPSLYILEQEFADPDRVQHKRIGFIGACEVVDFSARTILPHERTLSKPKEDRFKLLHATNTNFSQIFGLYRDPGREIDGMLREQTREKEPLADVLFDGVINRLWNITDEAMIGILQKAMKDRTILIADGHHRYETALAYRDMMRMSRKSFSGEEPFNYTMMFFANMDANGLVVLPTHRLLRGLEEANIGRFRAEIRRHFTIQPVSGIAPLALLLAEKKPYSFGVVQPEGISFIYPKNRSVLHESIDSNIAPEVRELDVTLLHSYLFEDLLGISREAQEQKMNLEYVKSIEDVEKAVAGGRAQMGFILNPTPIDHVQRVSKAGLTMPQKSTFFYPKLISGLVMNPLEWRTIGSASHV